jgi:hypothetical protein
VQIPLAASISIISAYLLDMRNYDHLTEGINSSTETGKAYTQAVYALTSLINETEGFNVTFSTTMRRLNINQKLNTASYVQQLEQVIKILEQLHQPVKLMTKIEIADQY